MSSRGKWLKNCIIHPIGHLWGEYRPPLQHVQGRSSQCNYLCSNRCFISLTRLPSSQSFLTRCRTKSRRTNFSPSASGFSVAVVRVLLRVGRSLDRNKNDLAKQLTELKTELLTLRVQKIAGGSASKLTKMYVYTSHVIVFGAHPRTVTPCASRSPGCSL